MKRWGKKENPGGHEGKEEQEDEGGGKEAFPIFTGGGGQGKIAEKPKTA